jgi:hypothetical protein
VAYRPDTTAQLSSSHDRPPRLPRSNLDAMTTQDTAFNLELSRRKLLAAAGIAARTTIAASFIGTGAALAAPPSPDPPSIPPVAGCICSSARMHPWKWWCRGTRCNPCTIHASCLRLSMARSTASSRLKRPATPTQSRARLSMPIMRKSASCGPTPLISTGRRHLPGRRQLVCLELFGGRAEGLAGEGVGRRAR